MDRRAAIVKLWRFATLYGPRRAVFKAAGRLRKPVRLVWRPGKARDILMIGCGQFAYSTIAYFLTRRFGARIRACYDPDRRAALSFAKTYAVPSSVPDAAAAIADPEIRYVYIASNHASHTQYAVQALEAGKTVYVEKPVSVSPEQFAALRSAARGAPDRIFVGYNRPFSAAVEHLKAHVGAPKGALSLACFVSGHLIGPEHWYRAPEEGTRICGNAGHWIDLFVHLLNIRGIPGRFELRLAAAAADEPDDNFVLTIVSEAGDIFSLMLTSRTEPFEGINETINLQWDQTIAKIDDFRRLVLWQGTRRITWRFWPKDVGHCAAVLQPFADRKGRDWQEVEVSTGLMLRVAEMVRRGEQAAAYDLADLSAAKETAQDRT